MNDFEQGHSAASGMMADATQRSPLQIWGGAEYTCNRVGDRYFDQMALSGHAERHSDIAAIAELGIRTLRCGLLWERHEQQPCWTWSDTRMAAIRQHGITPIAGLLHHGSGPPHTSLLDDDFPEKLARYAGEVARRYPWIEAYTPVNEPHTTARFSTRYGLWYPHHKCPRSYVRALLNQMKATVLSMQAVREVRSDARLIQTEDVGDISGTPRLREQWELLNERQWLPFDLLYGRGNRHHPLYAYLLGNGISERELAWFEQNPCPPDVIGLNYYPTSNRWIDERLHLYPPGRTSAEGEFVDVEAVRVFDAPRHDLETLLSRAWNRYNTPVAVTEVHLGGPAEDQVRWLADIWEQVTSARQSGIDCVAMTVWALFGSFYWNELVTRENGHYEPGLFDVSRETSASPRLASLVRKLSDGSLPNPHWMGKGWWKNRDRFCFPETRLDQDEAA